MQLEECLGYVQANPRMFEVVYKHYHRAIIRRFPYVVFYTVNGNVVKIHAVFQSAQNPQKWRQRLP